ncbi:MAG: N-acetylglucosamine-6-phosphate deacetylase [Asticcacaulis sp.]
MTVAFFNGHIATKNGLISGGLVVAKDRITEVAPQNGGDFDLEGGYLLPGFIDTQVNGGGGVLFNDDTSVDAIAAIGAAHRPYGTTGFLPTLISDELEVIDAAMRATEDAIAQGVPGVLGIHIEGPFISEQRKGIHDPDKFRRLTEDSVKLLSSLKRGKTLVTLAPEHAEPAFIRALKSAGVVIAAGHTDATYAQARTGIEAGITGVTHLFNAMSPLSHRAPGVVGAALEDQSIYCGIIVDGHHVDAAALRIALRTKPCDRFMLVTDAMPTVGSDTKQFNLMGKHIVAENGVCVGPDGTLAGSDLDMATAVRNTVNTLGVSLKDASVMAAYAPARFMELGEEYGQLHTGARADLVWLDKNLQVRGVWINGEGGPV